jgi:predicted metalloendopeptidase
LVAGRQFDKDGNLKQWWEPSVVSRFKSKAQCIIDQYGNYTVEEVNMNVSFKSVFENRETKFRNLRMINITTMSNNLKDIESDLSNTYGPFVV